jgi:hypothetical protein
VASFIPSLPLVWCFLFAVQQKIIDSTEYFETSRGINVAIAKENLINQATNATPWLPPLPDIAVALIPCAYRESISKEQRSKPNMRNESLGA